MLTDKATEELAVKIRDIIVSYGSFVRERPGAAHFPDLELILLFCANIVTSIAVNLVSSRLYERYFAQRNSLYTQDELSQVRRYAAVSVDGTEKTGQVERSVVAPNVEDLLRNLGMPRSVRIEVSERVLDAVFIEIQERAGEVGSEGKKMEA